MSFFDFAVNLSFIFLSATVILLFIRLAIGPSLEDRVVALDLLTSASIAIVAVYAVKYREAAFLDVGLILALVAFLGTIGFAYYLEMRFRK